MSAPAADAVKQALANSARALAETLFPHGDIDGGRFARHVEWHGRGPDGAKWGVVIAGSKVGRWQNFGTGEGGHSLLSLIRDACCDGDHIAAFRWALAWLGDGVVASLPQAAPDAKPPAPKQTMGNAAYFGLYMRASPVAGWDSPVGRYLEGRGILRTAFGKRAIQSLRYLPTCNNTDLHRTMPAMLAKITDPITGRHIATHRTYLEHDGDIWRKARIDTPKKVLGAFAGGLIQLFTSDIGLVLAEGIENALTVAVFFPELGAGAYVAAGNLANLTLPDAVRWIVLVRDRDGINPPIEAGRAAALARWGEEGRAVDIWEPPAGCHDANDYLRQCLAGVREEI